MEFWRLSKRPALTLFDAPVFRLGKLIESGMIHAVAVRRPWHPGDPAYLPPGSARNWLLITPENIGELRKSYPGVFLRSEEGKGDDPASRPGPLP
jgi:hypothetical protein